MQWQFGASGVYVGLFWGFLFFGVAIGGVAFFLMGRPFDRERRGRPLLGLFCGLIFGASFWLLGNQMVSGRFFQMNLVQDHLELELIHGRKRVLEKTNVLLVEVKEYGTSGYLLINTSEGALYRGGPVDNAGEIQKALLDWMAQP